MAIRPINTLEICSGVGMRMKKCPTCQQEKPLAEFRPRKSRPGYYSYCHPCMNERSRPKTPEARQASRDRNIAYRARIRDGVLEAYGGKCECCGERRKEFLALDHRNGGGSKERRELASNTSGGVYRLARDLGYPKDKYRLLCHNCNCSLGWYGYCPHKRESLCG